MVPVYSGCCLVPIRIQARSASEWTGGRTSRRIQTKGRRDCQGLGVHSLALGACMGMLVHSLALRACMGRGFGVGSWT